MSTDLIKPDSVASEEAPTIPEVLAVTDQSMPPVPVPVMTEPNKADALAPKPLLPTGVATRPASIKPPAVSHPPPAPVVPNSVSSSFLANNKSKSKKKKQTQPTVTMATASAATAGAPGALGENTGRWTAEEHRLFLQGLDQHGKGWKKIASLIKSRTVVQIRTHAQKYFQKLAKARQNGEEGDVAMEGRGGVTSIPMSPTLQSTKRRRQTGTKRKAISSVVASSHRRGKRLAAAHASAGVPSSFPPLPAVAPALAPFVPPSTIPSITTLNGTISLPALEDSLFRFLTPAPVAPDHTQVNDVARQAGANKITVPYGNHTSITQGIADGEVSPTGVNDLVMYPSWGDVKDMPSWFARGADVDCLLDVADTLDWLTDTGDLNETYEPPKVMHVASPEEGDEEELMRVPNLSTDVLAAMDSDAPVAALPSLFENSDASKKQDAALDEHLNVFDTPMEEHAFVSALLENNGDSSGSLPVFS